MMNCSRCGFSIGHGEDLYNQGVHYNEDRCVVLLQQHIAALNRVIDNADKLPDAPKSDWMQLNIDTFLNIVTGMAVTLEIIDTDIPVKERKHRAIIYTNGNPKNEWYAWREHADSFAALVGYSWSS
jgi:hypothetical protein